MIFHSYKDGKLPETCQYDEGSNQQINHRPCQWIRIRLGTTIVCCRAGNSMKMGASAINRYYLEDNHGNRRPHMGYCGIYKYDLLGENEYTLNCRRVIGITYQSARLHNSFTSEWKTEDVSDCNIKWRREVPLPEGDHQMNI